MAESRKEAPNFSAEKRRRTEQRPQIMRDFVRADRQQIVNQLIPSDRVIRYQRLGHQVGYPHGQLPLEQTRALLDAPQDDNVYNMLFGLALAADTVAGVQNALGVLGTLRSIQAKFPESAGALNAQLADFVARSGTDMKPAKETVDIGNKIYVRYQELVGKEKTTTEGERITTLRELGRQFFNKDSTFARMNAPHLFNAYLAIVLNRNIPVGVRASFIKGIDVLGLSDPSLLAPFRDDATFWRDTDISLLGVRPEPSARHTDSAGFTWDFDDEAERSAGRNTSRGTTSGERARAGERTGSRSEGIDPLQQEIARLQAALENIELQRHADVEQITRLRGRLKRAETEKELAKRRAVELELENEGLKKRRGEASASSSTEGPDPFLARSDYEILGLTYGATPDQIKKAYINKANVHGHDRVMAAIRALIDDPVEVARLDQKALRRHQRINEAWDNLSGNGRRNGK
ncbi:MAG TPA: hypothetical protein VJC10_02230 [Patescibacteria group bacterium]|nr:hypothetical protein [Patescibacteria group bacterium]